MERLTLKEGLCGMASTEFCFEQKDCYTCPYGRKCFKRLAAYEDIGLTPEEIDGIGRKRLKGCPCCEVPGCDSCRYAAYTDMPAAMQIYNHYRKHWLAAYWQFRGMTVYPTVSWSTPESYAWCFDGEPVGGIVAVSSVGTQANKESKRLFLQGYEEMMKRLSPPWVIFYGRVPKECDWNIIRVRPHYDSIAERCDAKRAAEEPAAGSA